MNTKYTAVIQKDGNWWIGWIKEVAGVNCQERTYEELMETIKITLKEALEFEEYDRKTSISKADSYQAIGEFWDNHDLGDYWDKTEPAEFEINIESEKHQKNWMPNKSLKGMWKDAGFEKIINL
jgi:predicted RNase H-like HicB family nuclease